MSHVALVPKQEKVSHPLLNTERIRLILVDRPGSHRDQLQASLVSIQELEIVGEKDTFSDALLACEHYSPHVILLNLEHVEDADLLIWAKVQEGLPEIKLVVLFSEVDGQTFQKAFEMKAQGFASLKTPPEDLIRGITMVATGVVWIDARIPNPYLFLLRRDREHVQRSKRI